MSKNVVHRNTRYIKARAKRALAGLRENEIVLFMKNPVTGGWILIPSGEQKIYQTFIAFIRNDNLFELLEQSPDENYYYRYVEQIKGEKHDS